MRDATKEAEAVLKQELSWKLSHRIANAHFSHKVERQRLAQSGLSAQALPSRTETPVSPKTSGPRSQREACLLCP